MAKKDRMMNGLDMLFENNSAEESEEGSVGVQTVRLSLIEPDKKQPRSSFDEERLKELADNIERHGVLQPILVRPVPNGGYRIVAGERRWRAARLAGLTELPVVVRELDDFEAAQISLIENLQREDLNPVEEAEAYSRLMDEFGMTQEQLSESVGRSRSAIANSVRLLKLPDLMKKSLINKEISVGQAKVLCGAGDDIVKQEILFAHAKSGMTVRGLEEFAAKYDSSGGDTASPSKPTRERSIDYSDPFKKYAAETALSFKQLYGVDARVEKDRKGYSLKFSFKSEEELKELIKDLSQRLE